MAKNKYGKSRYDIIAWLVLFALWGVYAYFTFIAPNREALARYHIDAFQLNFLKFTIAVPVLIIWSAMLYSCLKLYDYSQTILKSEDGQAFRLITQGIFFMLVSNVATTYISLLVQFSQNDQALVKSLRISSNYIGVFLALLSFFLLWKGSKKLISMVHAEKKVKQHGKFIWFSVLLLSLPYIYFVLQNPVRSVSNVVGVNSTYNLPDLLIFITIVAPYILTWLLGIYSIVNMSIFREETNGIIYKNVLGKFYKGFLTVIIFVISLQYLTQFSTFFANANLSIILVLVYAILVIDAVGLVLVAEGARQLTKIETI